MIKTIKEYNMNNDYEYNIDKINKQKKNLYVK